jgi:hypothetical protein
VALFPDFPLAGATRGFCGATLAFFVASGSSAATVVAALIFAAALGTGRVTGLAGVAYQVTALLRDWRFLNALALAVEHIKETGAATGGSELPESKALRSWWWAGLALNLAAAQEHRRKSRRGRRIENVGDYP